VDPLCERGPTPGRGASLLGTVYSFIQRSKRAQSGNTGIYIYIYIYEKGGRRGDIAAMLFNYLRSPIDLLHV
jgi:hypothetical protein